jgi:hypothetical protein
MAKRPEREIASRAEGVLQALNMWRVPVDPVAIAEQEGIELAAGNYGERFDGRIRYLREIETFALAYQAHGPGRTRGRVRFTLGHELGHYYLHRDYLLSGRSHGSKSDFRSADEMEQEADEFAAALLMPLDLFRAEVKRYRQHVCVLKELCELAEDRLGASVTSTVRRYCLADIEPCLAVFSRDGVVQWACCSEDMRRLNMGYVPFRQPLPTRSLAARSYNKLTSAGHIEGEIEPSEWFESPYHRGKIWEESMLLGNDGLALTYLTLA